MLDSSDKPFVCDGSAVAEFAPFRARMRRHRWWMIGGFLVYFGSGGVAALWPQVGLWIMGSLLLGWCCALGGAIASAFTRFGCPRCSREVRDLGTFCPECGAAGLTKAGRLKRAHCGHCGKHLVRGRWPNFVFRVCSHCRVLLDPHGFR